MSFVVVERLCKAFGPTPVFSDVDLSIARGEMCVLVGPSGCGKTTLLRAVAGLVSPDAGRILIDGEDMTATPPQKRGVGMVFQHYALFPNMTVRQNIAFGLEQQKLARPEVDRRCAEMIDLVGLGERVAARPSALSGGQRQRVALARALVMRPKLILFDEPMSALDAQIRKRLRDELKRLQVDLGFTGLFVTHDQEEALVIGDRIAVMQGGQLQQVGMPFEIYNHPASRAVAHFIGDFNVLEPAEVEHVFGRRTTRAWAIHPEGLALMRDGTRSAGDPSARAIVLSARLMGATVRYEVEAQGRRLKADALNRPGESPIAPGTEVAMVLAAGHIRELDS